MTEDSNIGNIGIMPGQAGRRETMSEVTPVAPAQWRRSQPLKAPQLAAEKLGKARWMGVDLVSCTIGRKRRKWAWA